MKNSEWEFAVSRRLQDVKLRTIFGKCRVSCNAESGLVSQSIINQLVCYGYVGVYYWCGVWPQPAGLNYIYQVRQNKVRQNKVAL